MARQDKQEDPAEEPRSNSKPFLLIGILLFLTIGFLIFNFIVNNDNDISPVEEEYMPEVSDTLEKAKIPTNSGGIVPSLPESINISDNTETVSDKRKTNSNSKSKSKRKEKLPPLSPNPPKTVADNSSVEYEKSIPPPAPVPAPSFSVPNEVSIDNPVNISFSGLTDGKIVLENGEVLDNEINSYTFDKPGNHKIYLKDSNDNSIAEKSIIVSCTKDYAAKSIDNFYEAVKIITSDKSSDAYVEPMDNLKDLFSPGNDMERIIFLRRNTEQQSDAHTVGEFLDNILINPYSHDSLSEYFTGVKGIETNPKTGKIDKIYLYDPL